MKASLTVRKRFLPANAGWPDGAEGAQGSGSERYQMKSRSYRVIALSTLVLVAINNGSAAAGLSCYARIPATMLTTVKSAGGFSGQVFRFKTTASVTSNGILVPSGTLGYGIVLSAIPASNRARNGIVVLEARYLILGGQRVQVTGDPVDASILTHGASLIGLGAGAIPVPGLGFILDEAIQGTDITVGPGYQFHVVPIGDLQQRGPCQRTVNPPR